MSKSEIAKEIAKKSGLSQADASRALNAFLEVVTDQVSAGKNVTLVGFGTFYRAQRKATTGRNPRTGAPIQIKAAKLPKFRAGKGFKDAVN